MCIVKSHGDLIDFPPEITEILQTCSDKYETYPPPNKKGKWENKIFRFQIPEELDFFWVVSDISELKHVGFI